MINYILSHKRELADLSIRDLAQRTYSSPAGIFRLCQKLGLKGYNEFKLRFISEFNRTEKAAPGKEIKIKRPITSKDNPEGIVQKMAALEIESIEETKNDTGIILNLAINYGGQAEILHAVRSIAQQVADGSLKAEDIDASVFENNLYSKGLPSPDLLIRTGGDLRVSNFLLWQIAYSEIWTTQVFWPDFTPDMLVEAIKVYQKRERRFGGLVQK
jgi:undecaprenyl diphosphate synthase